MVSNRTQAFHVSGVAVRRRRFESKSSIARQKVERWYGCRAKSRPVPRYIEIRRARCSVRLIVVAIDASWRWARGAVTAHVVA